MARIIVIGGGVVGLCSALLLGRDGHEVTVLERDSAPAPEPQQAWQHWERRGVNQFRMLHFFQPRFREIMETNVPEVIPALIAAGATRVNPFRDAPAEFTGGFREGDERYDAITARRPVAEAVISGVVAADQHITVRRGVVVVGLLTGAPSAVGVPNVIGVRTDAGEELTADLVIDACGRRSTLPELLAAIGATAPIEEKEDCGFVYYGRHFTSGDGSLPPMFGGLLMAHDTVSILTLPADNGTWGVALVTSAQDAPLRALKDVDVWTRVVQGFPLVAHWLDGTPLDDGVAVMAKIEDRHRTFVIDGQPVATGILALADSWACTNPSVGRGISIGTIHALALRDLLRDAPTDPLALSRAWHDVTIATAEPWYRSTLAFDKGRLEQIHASIEGREFLPETEYGMTLAMGAAAGKDVELFRSFLDIVGMNALPEQVLSTPGLFERVIELGADWREQVLPGLNREQLLAAIAA